MAMNLKKLAVAALIMALLPGLWNIVVAIGLTVMQGGSLSQSFFDRLWQTFNSFGLVESLIANVVFLLVAFWQATRLVAWTGYNRTMSKKMVLGAALIAASLHLGVHMAFGFFLWSDVRIALAIMIGAGSGMFVALHHKPIGGGAF